MGIERQGTRSTKHDGSAILLRKILKELKQINKFHQEGNDVKEQFKKILALQELGIEHQRKLKEQAKKE
jgi:hypothetical protein